MRARCRSPRDTGLYVAGRRGKRRRAGVLAAVPAVVGRRRQAPLDLAAARHAASTRRAPDAWEFPRGTRLWKEFATAARSRRASSSAPPTAPGASPPTCGTRRARTRCWRRARHARSAGAGAPGGRYAIPAEADCRACHEGAPVPVLGFSALQLSPDRDPLAPHADAAGAVRSASARGARPAAQPAAGTAGAPPRIAATTPDRTRRARLPARQLRQLPQR